MVTLSASWAIDLPAVPSSAPVIDAARAYVPLRSSELSAVALSDGGIVWSVPMEAVVAPSAIGDGLVFLAHARDVEAVDAGTGKSRWRVPVDAPVAAPLVWQNGRLLAVTERGSALMVRAATGETLWTRSLGASSRVEPAVADGRVYVALDDGRVVALALDSGATVWEARLPAGGTTLLPFEDRVFVGGGDKFFYCLSADRGKTKWRWRTGAPVVGRVAVGDKRVYFVALDNVLRALDRGNGSQTWKASLSHRPTAGPFLAARLLWVAGIAAELASFQTIDGSAAGASELAGEPAFPPRLLQSAPDKLDGVLLVTGEGKAQWLVPGVPPLPSKAIPGLPTFTTPPEIRGEVPEWRGTGTWGPS